MSDPIHSSAMDTTRSKNDSDEILYMDEIHNEMSKPLTIPEVHAAPFIRSRLGSFAESENRHKIRSDVGSEIGNLDDIDGRIDSDHKDEHEFSKHEQFLPNNLDSRDLFPPLPPMPDVNLYQHKKTVAQGMMDLALLSANANQMRYVLQTDGQHPYFYPSLTMIGMSLFLQVAVGVGLIWNSYYNVKEHEQMCKANKANNWTVIGIFLVTILNVFISSFGVVDQTPTT